MRLIIMYLEVDRLRWHKYPQLKSLISHWEVWEQSRKEQYVKSNRGLNKLFFYRHFLLIAMLTSIFMSPIWRGIICISEVSKKMGRTAWTETAFYLSLREDLVSSTKIKIYPSNPPFLFDKDEICFTIEGSR
jgi:hypothetical protein